MVIFYILFIGVGSFPLMITLWRMQKYRKAKKRGVFTSATVTGIHTVHFVKSLPYDRLTVKFHDLETGRSSTGQTGTAYNRYKIGDQVKIARGAKKGEVIIPDDIGGYLPMLWFSLALLLFVIFAAFKVEELVKAGY